MEVVNKEPGFFGVDLISRNEKYCLEFSQFSLPVTYDEDQLNELIKKAIGIVSTKIIFTFFYNDEPIGKRTLEELAKSLNIATENDIRIEFELKKNIIKSNKQFDHDNLVHSIDCSGKWVLSGCYDNKVYLWNSDALCMGKYEAHKKPIKTVSYIYQNDLNDIFFASGGLDTTVMISKFCPKTECFSTVANLIDHSSTVLSTTVVSKDTDRVLVSSSYDGSIKVWDISNEAIESWCEEDNDKNDKPSSLVESPIMTIGSHQGAASALDTMETGAVLSVGLDSTLRVWDVQSASLFTTFKSGYPLTSVSYSSQKRLAICGTNQKYAQIYDVHSISGSLVTHTLKDFHTNCVQTVAWSDTSENSVVTASLDGSAFLWDIRNPKEPSSKLIAGKDRLFSSCWKSGICLIGGESGKIYSYLI